MGRMLGKVYRTHVCEFGCCDELFGLGRRLVRRNRSREKARWQREARRN
jgi:hypothetical protein